MNVSHFNYSSFKNIFDISPKIPLNIDINYKLYPANLITKLKESSQIK